MALKNVLAFSTFLLCLITFLPSSTNGRAVMSIDLGSEWTKVAIVSPGVPMEIALNKESKRKTLTTISFRDQERAFGEDAKNIGLKYPKSRLSYLTHILGKSFDNPAVKLYQKRFPHYDIVKEDNRDTVAFRINDNTTYSPEELLAQILSKAKHIAEVSAGQKITEAVITVPGFFNQAQRLALLQSAELANIKVLQLINDYSAVALNYGIFNRKDISETPNYIMFYDMGASKTTATIVRYQNVKVKEGSFVDTHPQLSILGVGYDSTLGGLEMQLRLQKYLAEKFQEVNKSPKSVFSNHRAMAKLFEEAGRVKNVLSANNEHYAQIEGLLDEQDFKTLVTRAIFEELISDLIERVHHPIEIALRTSGLTTDIISQVVLVGGGMRVPKVQEKLGLFLNRELSKNINADEAAALGAAYKAADLSQGFKVKKFITKDAVLFPIHILFNRVLEDASVKEMKRILYDKMSVYPQKKVITFNKNNQDFSFQINYADLDYLSHEEILFIGNKNLSTVSLSGVSEVIEKSKAEGAESKGIKVHFSMDESGILKFLNAEHVSEKTVIATEEEKEGTFSKLGSTISKLFSGSDNDTVVEKETANATETKNETAKSEKEGNSTKKEEAKPEIVSVKLPIHSDEIKYGLPILVEEDMQNSRKKIKALDTFEKEKTRRENALNNLESFVIDMQMKLDSDEYRPYAKPEEADAILKQSSEISEWLYEDGYDASADVYEEKLVQLQDLTRGVVERVFESQKRPEIMKQLNLMLNNSRMFLGNVVLLNLSGEVITETEMKTLDSKINDTQDYFNMVEKVVSETPLHEPVDYKVRDIVDKMAALDREVKYLVNKLNIWDSLQKAKEAKEKATTKNNKKAENETESHNPDKSENDEGSDKEEVEKPAETVEEKLELPAADTNRTEESKTEKSLDEHQEL